MHGRPHPRWRVGPTRRICCVDYCVAAHPAPPAPVWVNFFLTGFLGQDDHRVGKPLVAIGEKSGRPVGLGRPVPPFVSDACIVPAVVADRLRLAVINLLVARSVACCLFVAGPVPRYHGVGDSHSRATRPVSSSSRWRARAHCPGPRASNSESLICLAEAAAPAPAGQALLQFDASDMALL